MNRNHHDADRPTPTRDVPIWRLIAASLGALILIGACAGDKRSVERVAQDESTGVDDSDAVLFVNRFYRRYIEVMNQPSREPAYFALARARGGPFSQNLRSALMHEEELQEQAGGAIVHLDADPFVGSQDPCETYEGTFAQRGDSTVRVDVYAVCGGARQSARSVTVEVRRVRSGWEIVDVEYPGAGKRNLLSSLAR